jgi:hypothetical protein
MNSLVLRTVLIAAYCAFPGLPLAAQFDGNAASPHLTKFYAAFNEGADCSRLYELRNNAKRNGADHEQQQEMNLKLRSVRCIDASAKRKPEVPPNTGAYTVNEYRIYREVMSSPSDMPEEQALGNVGKKYNMPPTQVRKIAEKVTRNLFENDWMDVLELEIRHASDWKNEKR